MFILCKDCKQENESENIVKWVFFFLSKFKVSVSPVFSGEDVITEKMGL